MIFVIMQGLPGSGKSYRVEQEYPNAEICSADDYFKVGGEYKFDRQKLGKAHQYCLNRAEVAVEYQDSPIVVDNTNTTFKEFKRYAELALSNDYDLFFCRSKSTWAEDIEECFKRNTHGVPKESIQRMADRMVSLTDIANYYSSEGYNTIFLDKKTLYVTKKRTKLEEMRMVA